MGALKTILNVEDNFENRLLVRRLLQMSGHHVIEAENAAQALDLLKNAQPDLILMDLNMPEVDGYALTNHLRSMPNLAKTPIVAITANVMKGDREKALAAGCDDYIEKPIDVDTFLSRIAKYL